MKQFSMLWLILSSLCFSCTKILSWYEGVKNPRLETHDRLVTFLAKQQLDTSEILCFKDTTALNRFYRMRIGLPEARFFNRKKELVDYREKPDDCNAKVGVFIEKMDSINQLPVNSKLKLDNFITDLAHASTLKPFQLEPVDYDVYLVIYWAKYLGKVNKHKVFEWEELAAQANRKGQKLRVIKVSADYQALWGITEEDVPEFDY